MLPSRLFRNTGISPPLRSLITPHPLLPASLAVQLRLRLNFNAGVQARTRLSSSSSSAAPGIASNSTSSIQRNTEAPALTDSQEPRLSLTFTCTAGDCTTRSSHTFTKRAYEKGIVLVQCPGCKNRSVSLAFELLCL